MYMYIHHKIYYFFRHHVHIQIFEYTLFRKMEIGPFSVKRTLIRKINSINTYKRDVSTFDHRSLTYNKTCYNKTVLHYKNNRIRKIPKLA